MTENSILDNINGYGDFRSDCEAIKFGEKVGQKICVSDNVKGTTESGDSFVVEMGGLSHLIEKDVNANSRITLQRNLTRKASIRTVEKKVTGNERENSTTLISSSMGMKTAATLHGNTLPEKTGVVAIGSMDHSVVVPQVHHQITITNGCVSSAAGGESKSVGKRFGFQRSSRTWTVDSRKIFFFFASLSCMGTILLIYFTLSMGRFDGDDNILN